MAADLGVEVGASQRHRHRQRVTSEDIRRAAAAPAPAARDRADDPVHRHAQGRRPERRRERADGGARDAGHEVDMTECVKLRNRCWPTSRSRYGVRISYTDIIVKAAARAIEDKPIVNSSLQGDRIVIHDQVNIGIATAIEGGLVVPVVKDVRAKTIPQISAEIKELAARARTGKAGGEDFKGGTFTITNLGAYGVDSFNPVITPGQSAILGVCRIAEKPAVVDGEIVIRSMMNLCLSFDHRVMDGAPAAEYLARLRQILESPYLMFM